MEKHNSITQSIMSRWIWIGGGIITLIVLASGVLTVHRSIATLRIVNIDPALDNVATRAPFLKLTFNKELTTNSLSVVSDPGIIAGTKVQGSVLTITLNAPDNIMDISQQYTVTIKRIAAVNGLQMKNKVLTFIPKDIDLTELSREQQQAILKQSATPPAPGDIVFNNLDKLFPADVAARNALVAQTALFNFSPFASEISVLSVSSNKNGDTTTDSFVIKADSKTFDAKIAYDRDHLRLYVYDERHKIIFDSKNLDFSQLLGE